MNRGFICFVGVMVATVMVSLSLFYPVYHVSTGEHKILIAFDKGGFGELDQATFDDGTIELSPVFKGGIQIGATYEKINRYNIWGIYLGHYWRKVS